LLFVIMKLGAIASFMFWTPSLYLLFLLGLQHSSHAALAETVDDQVIG
jgi:hypothetical protein